MTMQTHEETLLLDGPAGRLETRLRSVPQGGSPHGAAVLFHPHPLFGGTLDNKTLYRISRRLPVESGHHCLRVNFRGAGKSEGEHDEGRGELEDATFAIDHLADRFPELPLTVVGYSFGAVVGLRAGAAHERVRALVALGLPLQPRWDTSFLARTDKPRVFIQGEEDEFANQARLEGFARTLTGPVRTVIIPGASHLFTGQEDQTVDACILAINDPPTT
jgi:alpha/beta superfamily hydrolase